MLSDCNWCCGHSKSWHFQCILAISPICSFISKNIITKNLKLFSLRHPWGSILMIFIFWNPVDRTIRSRDTSGEMWFIIIINKTPKVGTKEKYQILRFMHCLWREDTHRKKVALPKWATPQPPYPPIRATWFFFVVDVITTFCAYERKKYRWW